MEKERDYKMSDVVYPSSSRTIRRIPISRKQLEEDEEVVEEYVKPRRKTHHKPVESKKKGGLFTKLIIVLVLVLCLGAIAAAVSLAYTKGTIVITPKKTPVTINTSFTTTDYKTITANEIAVETVAAKPGTYVQVKAKGTVSIVNTSTTEQELVVQTRIENSAGKIYRITKPIIIPAGKRVSVPVMADGAGEEWNMEKTTEKLKIPGFKGSKKYDQFYAELETDISGGFSGNKNVIDDSVYKETRDKLIASATDLVKSKIKSQVGVGFAYFDDLVVVDITELPQISKGNTQSQISIKASGIAYVFDIKDLLEKLGVTESTAEDLDTIKISSKSGLKYSTNTTLNLSAIGSLTAVGDVPIEKIKNEVTGIKIAQINDILKKYDGISKASIKVAPFWKKTFPTDNDRIIIQIEP